MEKRGVLSRMGMSGVGGRFKAVEQKLLRLGIRQEDIEERFVRSTGPGGQNVNKVATCVWLKHIPSGVEVKVQQERSQALNRLLARKLLLEKLQARHREAIATWKSQLAKLRRQLYRRTGQAKERVLAAKRLHSMKKHLRAKVKPDE